MLGILGDFFVDIVILIASVSFGNMLARDRITAANYKNGIILGVLCGIQGCIMMVYGVKLGPNLTVDFGSIPIIIMGLYSTYSSVMLTSFIIGLFRFVFSGWTAVSLDAFLSALLMGVLCGLTGKTKLKIRIKWVLSYIIVCILSVLGFVLDVKDRVLLSTILPAYLLGMTVITICTFFLKRYILQSNEKYYLLKESTNIDYLTGLHNARHFYAALYQILASTREHKKNVSLLFIDIDFFKKVNDDFGHLNGDIVLKELGRLLQQQSRSFDIVTRYGGEEFTVLLANCGFAEAMIAAERIRSTVENHEFTTREKKTIKITVSIGVSSYPETTAAEESLLEQADNALYSAKRSGRNRVCTSMDAT
jgi:diguanylate cyclase